MKRILLGCLLAFLLMSASAFATTNYSLNLINGSPGISGPYVNVAVNLVDSNTADITFTTLITDEVIFDQGAVAFNLNGTASSISFLTSSPSGNPAAGGQIPAGGTVTPNAQEDGWGVFDYTVDFFDGPSNGVTSITYRVDLASGTWASDAFVLDTNVQGRHAAAHVWLPTGGEGSTWYVTDGPTSVPEPATMLLLGLGLIGVAGIRRKLS